MSQPDPKPPPPVRDLAVLRRFHAFYSNCVHCGNAHITAAHLVGRGRGGDDHMGNLVPLCGSGSSGCHGAFDNGHTFIGDFGRRVTPTAVKASVAYFIRSEAGDDHRKYLVGKLGSFGAESFVQKLEAEPRGRSGERGEL